MFSMTKPKLEIGNTASAEQLRTLREKQEDVAQCF